MYWLRGFSTKYVENPVKKPVFGGLYEKTLSTSVATRTIVCISEQHIAIRRYSCGFLRGDCLFNNDI
jgi:hypothetical protein